MPRLKRLDITVIIVSLLLCLTIVSLQLSSSSAISPYSNWIFYLSPANARPSNLWLLNPQNPGDVWQMTFSETGIESFEISPDGIWLVYSEYEGASNNTHLVLHNLLTNQSQALGACTDSSCEYPVFAPNSRSLAYERLELHSDLANIAASSARVWLVDLSNRQHPERPLDTDTQLLSMMALWSPDGQYLAVFDRRASGIRLYNQQTGTVTVVEESYGLAGRFAFSSDSSSLIFAALRDRNDTATALKMLSLRDMSTSILQTDVDNFHPIAVSFSPDGLYLAALHSSVEMTCPVGNAFYLARILPSGQLQTLSSTDHCVQDFIWDLSGEHIFLPRILSDGGNLQAEIWWYTPADGNIQQLVLNARNPRRVP